MFVGRIFEGFAGIFKKYQQRLDIVKKGYMPHNELLAFAQHASMLLRPVARTSYAANAIGAKTSDYLALRKPILTLGEKNSISEQILSDTGSGKLFEYNDLEGISAYIKTNFEHWKKNGAIVLDNESRLGKYTTRYNVEKLVELFDRLIGA